MTMRHTFARARRASVASLAIALGSECIATTVALAQPAQATVPLELARLLTIPDPSMMATAMMSSVLMPTTVVEPSITVGAPPPGFPAAFVPTSPFRLVGGMRAGRTGVRVVGVVPAGDTRTMGETGRAFERAGWTLRERDVPTKGFQGPPSEPADAPSVYCHGDSVALVSAGVTDTGTHFLMLAIATNELVGMCRVPDRTPFIVGHEGMPVPTLTAPAGTEFFGGGSGGSDDDYSTRAQMATGLSPAALVAHYAPQLAAQGWMLTERTSAKTVGVQAAQRDTNGTRWNGTLLVLQPTGSTRTSVQFQLVRAKP